MKSKKIKVAWFSAGVSSFVASYLEKESIDKIMYIHIDNQHEDSLRFLKDCEKQLGIEIEILQSRYKNVHDVIKQFRYINGAYGAKCTQILKKRVRKEWEEKYKDYEITYVWGYDFNEKHRMNRLIDGMPEFNHKFPLIEKEMTKEDAHGLLLALGIKRPKMYDMGYQNNNCIGCVKGGMGYWNRIRVDFPDVFDSMAKLEREVGASCLKDSNGKVYLDELEPDRGRMEDEIMQDCGFFCYMNL